MLWPDQLLGTILQEQVQDGPKDQSEGQVKSPAPEELQMSGELMREQEPQAE